MARPRLTLAADSTRQTPHYSAERVAAAENWITTVASNEALLCRVGRHQVYDLLDLEAPLEHQRDGSYVMDMECRRGCGTKVTKFYGSSGIITRTKSVPVRYEYDPARDYLMPPEARMRLTREQRGLINLELIRRRTEMQKKPARRGAKPPTPAPLFEAPTVRGGAES